MRINIARPEISDEEIEAVCSVLKSGMIASGPETLAFESEFAEFVGCDFACAVNNGTSALSLALSVAHISSCFMCVRLCSNSSPPSSRAT